VPEKAEVKETETPVQIAWEAGWVVGLGALQVGPYSQVSEKAIE
jgi:hypothetical protein